MLIRFLDALKWILSSAAFAFAYFSGRKSKSNEIAKAEVKKLKRNAKIASKPRASVDDIYKWMRGE